MSTDTRPTTARRTLRIALASAAAVSALLLTAGCSAIQDIVPNKTPQKHFDAYSDAPRSGESEDLAFFMPKWVPEDAEDIDVRLHVSQPGYVIGFASKDGVDVDDCTPVDESYGGTAMTADFLPEELPTKGLVTCGDGRAVTEIDGRWYGWTTKDAIPGQDDTQTMHGTEH
ncbi:hypothetical protein [Curtobacterium poinsettiae]|uniref:hypothetical protein n=1 Tax=Curtobacterium TaxID=2034 RepID=UPI00217E7927|nr:hypothetical protein [Curtobacterium flaccumfaciens]MCS6561775.1 hypothetical protein [Curtobacterium flaccumfaciens pv. poinsettiae]UXN28897.1 hypothetical protein N8D75_00885 [Curtobacterium flaccumfaciens]